MASTSELNTTYGLSPRQQHIVQTIKARGLHFERYGAGWRVFGLGVDILTMDLCFIAPGDLVRIYQR